MRSEQLVHKPLPGSHLGTLTLPSPILPSGLTDVALPAQRLEIVEVVGFALGCERYSVVHFELPRPPTGSAPPTVTIQNKTADGSPSVPVDRRPRRPPA